MRIPLLATTIMLLPGAVAAAEKLPATFVDGRISVTPRTVDGETLTFFTDTGGGLFISAGAVARARLAVEAASDELKAEMGPDAKVTRLPAFAKGHGIPEPLGSQGVIGIAPDAMATQMGEGVDGMLGQAWFSGRVWTFDYPKRTLLLHKQGKPVRMDATGVKLGFKTGEDGERVTDFPRIAITVDGRSYEVLLDTGATTFLSDDALKTLGDSRPALRATSMIVDSVFQSWRAAHPDWRVIESAQVGTGSAMIEVPQVTIAGHTVGPVWFTHRPDKNFHGFMSSFMDQRVDGAIGGNALEHFRMTIDYPRAMAWFDCVVGCAPAE